MDSALCQLSENTTFFILVCSHFDSIKAFERSLAYDLQNCLAPFLVSDSLIFNTYCLTLTLWHSSSNLDI